MIEGQIVMEGWMDRQLKIGMDRYGWMGGQIWWMDSRQIWMDG